MRLSDLNLGLDNEIEPPAGMEFWHVLVLVEYVVDGGKTRADLIFMVEQDEHGHMPQDFQHPTAEIASGRATYGWGDSFPSISKTEWTDKVLAEIPDLNLNAYNFRYRYDHIWSEHGWVWLQEAVQSAIGTFFDEVYGIYNHNSRLARTSPGRAVTKHEIAKLAR